MQKHKTLFLDNSSTTITDVQSCLRLTDLDEIGDNTHRLYFQMLGLLSLREMTVEQTIVFWMEFLSQIGISPDTVTIHPDKLDEWRSFYSEYSVTIEPDVNNYWRDESSGLGGYSTEFYVNGVEIGNIVHTSGNSIDSGFGLERLMLVLGHQTPTKTVLLKQSILHIVRSGYLPSNKLQGYVLRKLIRLLIESGGRLEHPMFYQEILRLERLRDRYNQLKSKHFDKSPDWWWNTHGIRIDEVNNS